MKVDSYLCVLKRYDTPEGHGTEHIRAPREESGHPTDCGGRAIAYENNNKSSNLSALYTHKLI